MPQNHQNTKSHKKEFVPIPHELEEIGKKIVHAAYLVHRALGTGLLDKELNDLVTVQQADSSGAKKRLSE